MNQQQGLGDHSRTDQLEASLLAQLARLGAETLSFSPGTVTPYDVEFYRQIPRKKTRWGRHRYCDTAAGKPAGSALIPESCRGARPFLLRLGGFRRENIFTPDEIGQQISNAGILYTDGIGNGLFETLLLCRKCGIWPTFEAPALGFELPFAGADFPAFLRLYRKKLQKMRQALTMIEQVFGRPLIGREKQPWFLWLRYSPLALFVYAWQRNAEEIRREMQAEIGLQAIPAIGRSPENQAALARFWTYIRRRHAELIREMAHLFREEIVGDGLIIGNMHANPIVDYRTIGEAFDHPGVAVRPAYLEDPALAENYIAFSVQLFRDLSGKNPLVSIRTNLLSAGSRFIPGPNLIERWYGAAIRSGAMGFYLWPRDYPSRDEGPRYDGPMPGNPDPSARGRARWDDHLNIFSQINNCCTVLPPESDVGLLISWKTFTARHWIKTFHAFSHLNNIRVRCRFLEAEQIETGERSLSGYRLLIVPVLPNASDQLLARLFDFVTGGGVILGGQAVLARQDDNWEPRAVVLQLSPLSTFSQADGRAWYEPDLTKPAYSGAAAEVEARLKGLCVSLNVRWDDWVFNLNVSNLAQASSKMANFDPLPQESDLSLEHYFYEHSSDWIVPGYQNRPEESYRETD